MKKGTNQESKAKIIVQKIMKEKNLNMAELARAVGLTRDKIQSANRGNTLSLKFEYIENFKQAFPDLSREWLLTGSGPMYEKDRLTPEEQKQVRSTNESLKNATDSFNAMLDKVDDAHAAAMEKLEAQYQARIEEKDRLINWLTQQNAKLTDAVLNAGTDTRRGVSIRPNPTGYTPHGVAEAPNRTTD